MRKRWMRRDGIRMSGMSLCGRRVWGAVAQSGKHHEYERGGWGGLDYISAYSRRCGGTVLRFSDVLAYVALSRLSHLTRLQVCCTL